MTIYISLGKDCSVGWNIKNLINQPRYPFDFLRIYSIEWVLEWIMNGMSVEEFFEGLRFERKSEKFEVNGEIYKTDNLGFFHDFKDSISLEEVKQKYERRINRLKVALTQPKYEYIHFIRNGIEPKNLKKFKKWLSCRQVPSIFTIVNWKDPQDWKLSSKPWSDIFGLTHYRNFVEQSTDAPANTTLWRPELIEAYEKITMPGNYKMYVGEKEVMIAQINPYTIEHNYTRLYPYKEIKIKVSPGGFAQSNIQIANELYTFVANYVSGKELVSIYGRNSHHYLEFIKDLVKETKAYNPCKICVEDSENSVVLSNTEIKLSGFGIISPGRQGLKFEIKLDEYLYISCNEKTAMRDLVGKRYKKVKEFNLFPGTQYVEQVYLIN